MENHKYSQPPDGGWGWIVVLSVFIGNILIDGTISTFGIFYPYLIMEFGESPALTSLTGSLIPAIYMISAPLVGILIHRFDCRRVSVAGGLVAAVGFVVASHSTSIAEFAVFYGVFGGLGIGMNSLCGHLMVNTYFNERRGIANGIVTSGAGVGVFIMAPIVQYLLTEYSWRGAMLIYSGCLLQYCVFGMLLRPLQLSNITKFEGVVSVSESAEDNNNLLNKPLLVSDTNILTKEMDNGSKYLKEANYYDPLKIDKCMNPLNKRTAGEYMKAKSLPNLLLFHNEASYEIHSESECKQDNEVVKVTASDNGFLNSGTIIPKVLKPLDRKDILFSNSIASLKEYKSAEDYDAFVNDMSLVETSFEEEQGENKCYKARVIDCSVFAHSVYVPVLLGGIFVQMGQFIPSTFLPNHCLSLGLTDSDVTTILAVYGAMNIVGRLIAGFLANMDCISTLWLCTFGNLMCGLACMVFPFCTTLVSLCAFAAVFGCFIGYFGPLQVLIMVEYLGLEKLTSAMGILQLAKGPAALFGPPLAGLVYEWTRDYGMAMLVAAAMFILSSVFQSTVPLINRLSRSKR